MTVAGTINPHGELSYTEALDREFAPPVDESAPAKRRGLTVRSDVEIENLPPLTWLIDHMIPRGSLGAIAGPPGSGKSFIALDMAMSITAGIQCLGRSVIQGGALYLAAEGLGGLGQRVAAWKEARGFVGKEIGVGFVTTAVDMLEPANAKDVVEAARELRHPPALIVIDTLARSMIGDENDTRDMSRLIATVDRIRLATDAAVLLVHHTRKDSDVERGSSALRGGVDTLILCSEGEEGRQLVCQKQKDAEAFGDIPFRLVAGHTSCVVASIGSDSPTDPTGPSRGLNTKRLGALRSLADGFTPSRGASTTEWFKASELPERTFYNCRTWLVLNGYVTEAKNRYTLAPSGRSAVDGSRDKITTANSTANSLPNPISSPSGNPFQGVSRVESLPSAGRTAKSQTGSNHEGPTFFDSEDSFGDPDFADALTAELDERAGMQFEGEG